MSNLNDEKQKWKARPIPSFDDHERFFSKIAISGECWNFISTINKGGYGCFGIGKKTYMAHRVSYSLFHGDIPTDLMVDHMCRNRACVNPGHLRAVSCYVNTMENSRSISALNKAKSLCVNGHPLSGENLYVTRHGHRECFKCKKANKLAFENARGFSLGIKRIKTHCKNGHEFTPENTKATKSGRNCRICIRASNKISDAKRRLQPQEQEK